MKFCVCDLCGKQSEGDTINYLDEQYATPSGIKHLCDHCLKDLNKMVEERYSTWSKMKKDFILGYIKERKKK